ncbi:flagellar protein FlaG [Selenomonas sp.]|jgi:flagellar protein FlaG|uniref:flagellar protein FlaG n=1 Tax=Selenomonas sp. TaxID=2053611 RepID=UPI003A102F75
MIGKVQDLVSAAVVIGATESTPGINETAASEAASSAANQEQQPQQDMAETPAASLDILSQVKNAANGTDHMQDGKTDKDKQEGDLDKKLDEKSVSYITEELNKLMSRINCNLEFQYHKEVDMMSVKMLDKKTGDVLKEVPPEALIKHMIKAKDWLGAFLDKTV